MRPKDAKLRARVKQYVRLKLSTDEKWSMCWCATYTAHMLSMESFMAGVVKRRYDRFQHNISPKRFIHNWHTLTNYIMNSPARLGEVKREMLACNFMKTNDTVFVNSLAEVI